MPILASGRYSQPYSHNYNQKSKGLFLLEHILLLHTTKVDFGCMLAGSNNPHCLKADLVVCANPSSSSWVSVGKCFFWYRLTRVVPDKGSLNGCECVCVCVCVCY